MLMECCYSSEILLLIRNDTDDVSMALAQEWHAHIEKITLNVVRFTTLKMSQSFASCTEAACSVTYYSFARSTLAGHCGLMPWICKADGCEGFKRPLGSRQGKDYWGSTLCFRLTLLAGVIMS